MKNSFASGQAIASTVSKTLRCPFYLRKNYNPHIQTVVSDASLVPLLPLNSRKLPKNNQNSGPDTRIPLGEIELQW